MDTKRHPRCCPACKHHFIPWGVWRISTWTCLPCPKCGVRLNRRRDIQLVLVAFLMPGIGFFLFVFAAIHGLPLAIGIALIVLSMFIIWLVDVLTVRLVVAGRWRGLFGYET